MKILNLTKVNSRRGYGDNTAPLAPVAIAPDAIRCFYPRKNNEAGTRITFKDGGGFAVAEPFDEVKAYVERGAAPTPIEIPVAPEPAAIEHREAGDPENDEGDFHA
jgi:hypothetical protein